MTLAALNLKRSPDNKAYAYVGKSWDRGRRSHEVQCHSYTRERAQDNLAQETAYQQRARNAAQKFRCPI